MSNKTYVGSAKAIKTQHGGMLKLSFKLSDLQVLHDNVNGAGYVNLNVSKRKEVGQYGHTHNVWIDDWQPEKQQEQAQQLMNGEPAKFTPGKTTDSQPQGFDDFDDDITF